MDVAIKRVYAEVSDEDGCRVLVERLWPRGVAKEQARLERWLKQIAPSSELRTWFGHDPEKWTEFRKRYARELDGNPEAVQELVDLAQAGRVTLVYAARDETHNSAVVLKEYLEARGAENA